MTVFAWREWPFIAPLPALGEDGRIPCRARAGANVGQLFARHAQYAAERIARAVAEGANLVLVHEGRAGFEVGQRGDVQRIDPRLGPDFTHPVGPGGDPRQLLRQHLLLDGFDLGARRALDRGQLNASVNYDINRWASVGIEAINITREDANEYCINDDALLCYNGLTDRRIVAGLSVRF